jgi:anti-sigma-K factor RskA
MYNEDLNALAAEYVLGTLAAGERIDADRLIATDPGFGAIVHRWERRLDELNVMPEAIEPPPELWSKIESGTSAQARSDEVGTAVAAAPGPAEGEAMAAIEKAGEKPEAAAEAKADAAAEAKAEAAAEAKADAAAEVKADAAAEAEANSGTARGEGEAAQPASPAAAMSPAGGPKAEAKPDATPAPGLKPQPRAPLYLPETDSTQLQSLARRLRRWRLAAAASVLVAMALAALMALRAAPDRIALRAFLPEAARPTPPASVTRLVAVLQQEPSSPAFLLTIDPAARTLTVRRVAARARAGHSYELWVQAAQAKPRALGLVGDAEYTQQPLPSDFDVDAMRRGRYEISFEPTGGSKSGAPTGPILFTGTLVDAAQPPPPAPKN